jgi:hypothetical protein
MGAFSSQLRRYQSGPGRYSDVEMKSCSTLQQIGLSQGVASPTRQL